MSVHQGDQHAAALGRKLQTARDLLREKGAGIFVLTLVRGLAGVVQEQRQIKHRRILELLEDRPISTKLFLLREQNAIQFFDADQSVFIGGIAVIKFVLHEAGQRAELRECSVREILNHASREGCGRPPLYGKELPEKIPWRAGHTGKFDSQV